jgi:hypothetical protein
MAGTAASQYVQQMQNNSINDSYANTHWVSLISASAMFLNPAL